MSSSMLNMCVTAYTTHACVFICIEREANHNTNSETLFLNIYMTKYIPDVCVCFREANNNNTGICTMLI